MLTAAGAETSQASAGAETSQASTYGAVETCHAVWPDGRALFVHAEKRSADTRDHVREPRTDATLGEAHGARGQRLPTAASPAGASWAGATLHGKLTCGRQGLGAGRGECRGGRGSF